MPYDCYFGMLYSQFEEHVKDCPSGGLHVWVGCKKPGGHTGYEHPGDCMSYYRCKKCLNYLEIDSGD